MPVIKSQDKETRVERLLVALDSLWGKLVIIVVILCVGFKGGCYFQETKMTRNQLQKDKEQWEKWVDKEANYRSEIDRLKQPKLIHNMSLSLLAKYLPFCTDSLCSRNVAAN